MTVRLLTAGALIAVSGGVMLLLAAVDDNIFLGILGMLITPTGLLLSLCRLYRPVENSTGVVTRNGYFEKMAVSGHWTLLFGPTDSVAFEHTRNKGRIRHTTEPVYARNGVALQARVALQFRHDICDCEPDSLREVIDGEAGYIRTLIKGHIDDLIARYAARHDYDVLMYRNGMDQLNRRLGADLNSIVQKWGVFIWSDRVVVELIPNPRVSASQERLVQAHLEGSAIALRERPIMALMSNARGATLQGMASYRHSTHNESVQAINHHQISIDASGVTAQADEPNQRQLEPGLTFPPGLWQHAAKR
jgi:hypothetical protein